MEYDFTQLKIRMDSGSKFDALLIKKTKKVQLIFFDYSFVKMKVFKPINVLQNVTIIVSSKLH